MLFMAVNITDHFETSNFNHRAHIYPVINIVHCRISPIIKCLNTENSCHKKWLDDDAPSK